MNRKVENIILAHTLKQKEKVRAIAFTLAVLLVVTLIPLGSGSEVHATSKTLNIVVTGGTTPFNAEWYYDSGTQQYYYDTLFEESVEIVTSFAISPWTYNTSYGGIFYSGANSGGGALLGLVKSGFTLDSLKDYIAENSGIVIGTDAGIKVSHGSSGIDMSAFDDAPLYSSESFMVDQSTFDNPEPVPFVFGVVNYHSAAVRFPDIASLEDYCITTASALADDSSSLRTFIGQDKLNPTSNPNLGPYSFADIDTITFSV